ncbi:alpha/beta fold hydrolase [Paenibacillus paridis]|uniref:alpha/beta fold hydrolase n=1 Tax=Paenibacillus paridis TaxID=2583376 RepID=UPI00111E8579|nr:alpha/beta hydrolase [Paenibacillus paridis]
MPKISALDRSSRLLLSVIGFPLTLAQCLVTAHEQRKYEPEGWQADIGSRKLYVNVTGQGTPTIVLEAGMGGCSLDWSLVVPALSEMANVIAYDRAGFGWSAASPSLPTCAAYVEDLRALLRTLGAAPPYLLVGHSYGGLIMRLFASQYPEETCGLVLVDAAHEDRYLQEQGSVQRQEQLKASRKRYRLGYLLAPLGIPRMLKQPIGSKRLPAQWGAQVRALGYRPGAYRAAYAELLALAESGRQLKDARPLSQDLPVVVLSAGLQNEEWLQDQQKLLHLTRRTKQIIVECSWHSIHIHEPAAVIDAIKNLLYELKWPVHSMKARSLM